MALEQTNYKSKVGITLPSAYHMVAGFSYSQLNSAVKIMVATFYNKASRDAGERFLEFREYIVENVEYVNTDVGVSTVETGNFDGYFGLTELERELVNPIEKCYEYIKTLDDFKDCVDA